MGQILLLGVGNTLLADEGVGVHALQLLQATHPTTNVCFIDGGTLSFSLAQWIADCPHLIVLDAAQLKQPAGTVKTFVGQAMDRFLGQVKRSVHEVSLLDLLDIARLTDTLPQQRALIGIQPEKITWRMQPTLAVKQALPVAVDAALQLMAEWRSL